MAEIWTDFDPNLDLPIELVNVKIVRKPDVESTVGDTDAEIDIQSETLDDDDSIIDEDEPADNLDVPGSFAIISQTIHTGADGTQVVDVVIDVEEVSGAISYDVRISK